jgi:hypothetical protein
MVFHEVPGVYNKRTPCCSAIRRTAADLWNAILSRITTVNGGASANANAINSLNVWPFTLPSTLCTKASSLFVIATIQVALKRFCLSEAIR